MTLSKKSIKLKNQLYENIVLQPFRMSFGKRLLIFGLIMSVIAIIAATLFAIRYDGALDLHMVSETVPLETVLIDLGISISTMVLMLFVVGKIYNGKTRCIDLVTTVLIARIPFLLVTPFNTNHYMGKLGTLILQTGNISALETTDLILFYTNSILAILLLIWFITLLWNGFKTATNAKGVKSKMLFVIGVLSAEVISKILLDVLS